MNSSLRRAMAAAALVGCLTWLAACGTEADADPEAASPEPAVTLDSRPLEEQLADGIRTSNAQLVELAIDAGADVNADYGSGVTPLVSAVLAGDPDIVRLISAAGADLDAVNAQGRTALHTAVVANGAAVVTALLEAGADWSIESTPPLAATPAHLATENDNVIALAALLEFGVPADVTNEEYGSTPLFYAAMWDAINCARLLVDYGANFDFVSPDGTTPLAWARVNRSTQVVDFLEQIGAQE